jgi:hypothetical protein
MKIDRHNYEEYFLLYVDNELNVEQKKEVDSFVLANPDLEEEFIMVQQTRLVPDHSFVFEGKENLMKEESAINMNNYEEWLVLYVDNELTTEQKLIVEKFAAAHQHVKEELDLFLQTRLEPQEIVFTDKASLYRREEKVRIVSMSWWRVAVAAILIIAAGLGTYSIINNNKKSSTGDIANGIKPAIIKSNQKEQKINTFVEPQQETTEINQEKNKTLAVKENKGQKKDLIQSVDKRANDNSLAKNEQQTPNQSTTIQKESTHTVTNPNAFIADNGDKQKQTVNNSAVTNNISQTPDPKKLASEIVYVDPGPDADNGSDENKKLRGFFRRAARFIERTTKVNPANDDNKVLIGSMAVSLK